MRTGVGLWVLTGLVTSVLAPGIVLLLRSRLPLARLALPAPVIAPLFVLGHGAITVSLLLRWSPGAWAGLHVLLLAGGILYWLPVLAGRSPLGEVGRFLYLILTSPALDFAGVAIVALGAPAGGVAMILAMLPVNLTACVLLWRWMSREDELADLASVPLEGAPLPPPAP